MTRTQADSAHLGTLDGTYLKTDQTTPQTTLGTFTFENVHVHQPDGYMEDSPVFSLIGGKAANGAFFGYAGTGVTFYAGSAGDGTVGGAGGDITMVAGNGGAGTVTNGNPGNVYISPGAKVDGTRGSVNIAENGGTINIGLLGSAGCIRAYINGGLNVGGIVDPGDNNILATGTITGTQLISNIATGTSPLSVTSTTVVSNLNADSVDGYGESAFVLLAGRAGGQTIYGGTGANDDITIEGTSHATKTSSYVILQPNGGNVGIGTTSPSALLHVGNTTNLAGFTPTVLVKGGATSQTPGIEIIADTQTDGAYLSFVTKGAVGGTGGGASISFFDGSSTAQAFTFSYAGGNAAGSRYGGLFAYADRDGNAIPIRMYTQDAGRTARNALYIQGGQTAGTSGNVGINTLAPGAKLQVNGDAAGIGLILRANATAPGNLFELQDSGGSIKSFFTSTGDLYVNNAVTSGNGTTTVLAQGGSFIVQPNNSSGTQTITTANAGVFQITKTGDGNTVLTTANVLKVSPPGLTGSGTLTGTNLYGLYIGDFSTTTAKGTWTNQYAINVQGGKVHLNDTGEPNSDFIWESDTEANMLFGDANADTDGALYLGGSTNGIKINKGGELTLIGTATVWDDLQFPIAVGKVPATNAPTFETFTTNTRAYAFSVDDYIDLQSAEPPHAWKEGSTADVHIHIALKTAQNTGSNRYAKFTVYIAIADHLGTTTELTPVTAELTIGTGSAALKHYMFDMGDVTLTGYHIGSQFTAMVKRIAATGGTEYADDVYITQVGMHMERDSLGSKTETSK